VVHFFQHLDHREVDWALKGALTQFCHAASS
jgi:hypothetical protein